MNILFLIGCFGAFIIIGLTAMVKGVPVLSLVGAKAVSAMLVVFGGVIMALLVGHELGVWKKSIQMILKIAKASHEDPKKFESKIEKIAQMARKDGLLALEAELDQFKNDPFLFYGLRMLVDNVDFSQIEVILNNFSEAQGHEFEEIAKFWEDAGAFAPAIGITGAVLGLMVVMLNLQDQSKIGPGIFTAFIATLYGVSFANFFALPLSKRVKAYKEHQEMEHQIRLNILKGLANGSSPQAIIAQIRAVKGVLQ